MNEAVAFAQQLVITVMALGAAVGVGHLFIGRKLWDKVFGKEGWFARLDSRFEALEKTQAEDRLMADTDRRAQTERNAEINRKMDAFSLEQREQRQQLAVLADNHQALALTVAKLEGKEEARAEAAQLAGAASRIAEAITHPQEEAPRHDQL